MSPPLVAVHLLKWVHFRQDAEGLDLELRYFRDVDGREVDFVVTNRRTPVLIVECKLGDAALDPSVRYLKAKFPACPAWQIHAEGSEDYQTPEGIRVAPAVALLETLVSTCMAVPRGGKEPVTSPIFRLRPRTAFILPIVFRCFQSAKELHMGEYRKE